MDSLSDRLRQWSGLTMNSHPKLSEDLWEAAEEIEKLKLALMKLDAECAAWYEAHRAEMKEKE